MITAPLPRASPSGSGRLSMIIPQNHGLTITYMLYQGKITITTINFIESELYQICAGVIKYSTQS